ncbi:MAG TPA: TolC family protein [Candidatus Aquilonibacter sp.]|nr:TolC family protein [Candidatus Aquilonibacter sp.]
MRLRTRSAFTAAILGVLFAPALPAQSQAPAARRITLDEAVQLALAHNHVVRIANFKIDEKEHEKDVAKSAYFPSLKNESTVVRITDLQHVDIPAGSLGTVDGEQIPAHTINLLQGGQTFETSGTSLSEPLTSLLKVKAKNDVAAADLNATRDEARQTQNEVALKVRQIYYGILIAQMHLAALKAGVTATQDIERERTQQVKFGSALDEDLIESKAQSLESKQALLTAELQISDLTTQLDDAIGLPLDTQLALDSATPQVHELCQIEECKHLAVDSHPDVKAAEQKVAEAAAAVRLARRDYLPDTEIFARYSYQNNVPFLVHNFGTFGFLFTYDIFDGGRKRAVVAEQRSQLDEANENLSRVKEEVELHVQIAYNKLDRTREMVTVSQQLLALREESYRVANQQLEQGTILQSQLSLATERELDAKAALLQSQLDYVQAQDELSVATGQTPE